MQRLLLPSKNIFLGIPLGYEEHLKLLSSLNKYLQSIHGENTNIYLCHLSIYSLTRFIASSGIFSLFLNLTNASAIVSAPSKEASEYNETPGTYKFRNLLFSKSNPLSLLFLLCLYFLFA